ncbi:uncharacterized protein LOC129599737 [Paramacrobiotus metropolitanus]|uniref:uncharacterized protein LOC129599737 n=1 Tax=Paramacrobiotus metropolitanus TaxID=2943436 RepID=UPI00244630A4|nr:uncharacterized protein LOC129599737 [Paramacrobiotus metropolitanus]
MSVQRLHLLAISFPALGHAIPLFECCRKLSKHHDITYAVSRSVADTLRPREFASLQADEPVTLVAIEDGIRADRHMTSDDFLEAHDMIINYTRPGVARFIQQYVDPKGEHHAASVFQGKPPPRAIIFDMFITPAVMGTRLPDALYLYFNPSPAYYPRYIVLYNDPVQVCPLEEQDPYYTLPAPGEQLLPQSEMNIKEIRPIAEYLSHIDGMICNSFRKIDAEDLREAQKDARLRHIRFFCLGPFIARAGPTKPAAEVQITGWLDKQAARSVVFVSFGSMAVPKPEEIRGIGSALLATGRPFIWSLRKGHEQHLPEGIRRVLQEDVLHEKYVVVPWAPQKAILAHPATALFVSHCGWNSALETMSSGVPVLAWPMWADQKAIGEMFVKLGAGTMIPGTSCSSTEVVPEDTVTAALTEALGNEKYYAAAQQLKADIDTALDEGGTSQTELQELLQFIDQAGASRP